jgi:hypothetical protein
MKRACFVCLFLSLFTPALFSQSNPTPLVNQPLVPSSAEPGSPALTLTVYGAGFVSASVVNWNGTPLYTSFVSADKLQADVPASNLDRASTAYVTVSSPAPGGGTSNPVPFTTTKPTTSVTLVPVMHAVGVTPAEGLVVADFDGDGESDLAVFGAFSPSCGATSGAISILLGNGHGGFKTKSTICSYGNAPFAGVAGDFNHDGKMDLAVLSANGDVPCGDAGCAALTIYLGNGDGTFTEYKNFGLDGDYFSIATADFNRDGNLDLAVSYVSWGIPDVAVFLGDGNGSFNGFGNLSDGYLASSSLALGDFNNDGIVDIASVGYGGTIGGGPQIGPVAIFLGNPDGGFTLAPSQPNIKTVNPTTVMAGDFTGNGNLDLAIADEGSTTLTILKGKGDGTFKQVTGEPTLPLSSNLVGMADFNGDGILDLAYSTAPNTITLFLGKGDGTFQPGLSGTVANGQFAGGGVGDFNGDGRLDLAIANSSDSFFILRQKVPPPRDLVTLSSGLDPSLIGQPVTYKAVVSASPYSPTGSVTFKQGETVLGTAPLVNGQATFTATFAKAGTFRIVANYSGDDNYRTRNSNAVVQIVNKYTTATHMYSNPNPSAHRQRVTFTATVSSTGPLPTGKVVFKNGSTSLGSVDLVNGVATLAKSNLPLGSLSITATYDGDAESGKSTSPVLVQLVN